MKLRLFVANHEWKCVSTRMEVCFYNPCWRLARLAQVDSEGRQG